jgi:CubicO group peptidase (beta-lactamase class C family)
MRDPATGPPNDASTIFRIASMTKPVTSVAILILADDGALKLDDPVSKYLPEFKNPSVLALKDGGPGDVFTTEPADRPITIQMLLTHTSGLSYRFMNPPLLGKLYVEAGVSDGLVETPGTIGDNIKRLARLPLLEQPGTQWVYSLSTDVLGRVVEVASGRTFAEFVRERITSPLGMDDTQFLIPPAKAGRLVALTTLGPDKTVVKAPPGPTQQGTLVYSATYPTWTTGQYYSGGAGLSSTIGDYARFCQMLLNRGELDGRRILKAETVAAMTRDQVGGLNIADWGHGDDFGYGVGVVGPTNAYKDRASVGSFSWGGFFYTYFWVDPARELVGLSMTNIYPSDHLKIHHDFKGMVYDALKN